MPASPLPLLIRRARLVVDERRSDLAGVAEQEAVAEALLAAHDERRRTEEAGLLAGPPEMRAGYAAWARLHARERLRKVDLHGKLVRTREAAQDALIEACAEMKRLELAEQARQEAERRAAAKRAEAKAEEAETIKRSAGGA